MQSAETVMERVEGIEPSSPAWKAGVIAFIRYPQAIKGADGSALTMSRQCLLFALESIRMLI